MPVKLREIARVQKHFVRILLAPRAATIPLFAQETHEITHVVIILEPPPNRAPPPPHPLPPPSPLSPPEKKKKKKEQEKKKNDEGKPPVTGKRHSVEKVQKERREEHFKEILKKEEKNCAAKQHRPPRQNEHRGYKQCIGDDPPKHSTILLCHMLLWQGRFPAARFFATRDFVNFLYLQKAQRFKRNRISEANDLERIGLVGLYSGHHCKHGGIKTRHRHVISGRDRHPFRQHRPEFSATSSFCLDGNGGVSMKDDHVRFYYCRGEKCNERRVRKYRAHTAECHGPEEREVAHTHAVF